MDSKDTLDYESKISEAAAAVQAALGSAKIALVLGSGLGPFVEFLQDTKEMDYKDIPHMPTTSVAGHKGRLIRGSVSGKTILCLAGRTHAYEGYFMYQLTFMARVMHKVGVELYIATNSSGGCQPGMKRGCIMAIRDHQNWFKRNPLYDVAVLGQRHVDMRHIYSTRLLALARATAKDEHVQLFEGTYCGTAGPTYETFTEVEVGAKWGGSAFGMSTIPETMAAYSAGLEVFGCSMITNLAAGIDDSSIALTHDDVTGTAGQFAPEFTKFMLAFISRIATVPTRPLSGAGSSITFPLPQMQAPSPTGAAVSEASAFVLERAVQSTFYDRECHPTLALYVAHALETIVDYLEESRGVGLKNMVSVPYADIPHFPTITRSGRSGKLVLATVPAFKEEEEDTPVVFLTDHSLEGFNCEEGVFLALLLSDLGISKLIHTFTAGGASSQIESDSVWVLNDAHDWTTVAPIPRSTPHYQYMTTKLFNTSPEDAAELKMAVNLVGETLHRGSYMHILGPSFPTNSESRLAWRCNIELLGITSLSLVYAARVLGIDITGLVGVTYGYGENPLSDASYVLWKKLRSIVRALLAGNFLPKRKNQHRNRVKWSLKYEEPEFKGQVTYHLNNPVTQGNYDDIARSAAFLLEQGIEEEVPLAIIVDSRLPPIELANEEVVVGPMAYDDIPHFPHGCTSSFIKQKVGSISLVRVRGVLVLKLHGTFLMNEGRSNADVGHSVRVLRVLKTQRILFVNEMCSYNKDVPVDSVTLVRDHFNLSGRSSLFGHNEPRFGVRFPDMGNLYTDALRETIRRCAQQQNIRMPEVTCAFVVGPVFASLADANVVRAADCQVASTGFIPEVMVARHSGIPLAAIGVVKSQIVKDQHPEMRVVCHKKVRRTLTNVISSFVAHL